MFTAWVKNSLLGSRKIEFITWVNPSGEYSLLGSEHFIFRTENSFCMLTVEYSLVVKSDDVGQPSLCKNSCPLDQQARFLGRILRHNFRIQGPELELKL